MNLQLKLNRPVESVEHYIKQFPEETQLILNRIRSLIRENAPEAEEGFSYGMPAYKISNKPLVYFAGYAKHIGFYATPSGHTIFEKELSKYPHGKGSVQFPLKQEIPYQLIAEMVKFRRKEVMSTMKSRP